MKIHFSKMLLSIAIMFAIVTVLAACDLFDKADEITIPSEIHVTWTVDENAEHTDFAYTDTKTVKLSDDPELEKYISKIKDVKIEKITYKITDYEEPNGGAVYLKDGVASFATSGTSTAAVTVPFAATAAGVNLQTTTSETELTIDAAGLTQLAAIFKKEKQLDMNAVGILSSTPVSFKIVSTFHVKITAEVLN
jgi:hypothetical protein